MAGGETPLPAAARPAFEEGATLIFRRWTALQLAVEQVGLWASFWRPQRANQVTWQGRDCDGVAWINAANCRSPALVCRSY